HTSEAHTVVSAVSTDEADLVALTAGTVILKGHLQSRVHSGRATHGEEDVGEAFARKQIKDFLRKLKRELMRGVEAGSEVKLGSLILNGLNDPFLAVASVHAPQTRHT